MRLRSVSSVALSVSFLGAAACGSRAVAQIEFAHSTIRITSESESKTAEAPAAVQPQQQEFQQLFEAESSAPPAVAQPAAPAAPHAPIRRYDVRPANFAAPNSTQPQMPGRAPSLVGVYGGASARATLNKMPGPAPIQPKGAAPPKHARGKPFQGAQNDPAISPYLNMYRNEANSNGLPNYFAYVRPQLDQLEANRQQSAELQKLRGQIQNLSGGGGSGAPQTPSMGASAHYMDTAQFYRGLRR